MIQNRVNLMDRRRLLLTCKKTNPGLYLPDTRNRSEGGDLMEAVFFSLAGRVSASA